MCVVLTCDRVSCGGLVYCVESGLVFKWKISTACRGLGLHRCGFSVRSSFMQIGILCEIGVGVHLADLRAVQDGIRFYKCGFMGLGRSGCLGFTGSGCS